MIRLVIFDLDGVLTSTSVEHFAAWKKVVKDEFNIDIDDSVEEQTKGVSRMDSLERILESIGKETIPLIDKQRIANTKNEMYIKMIRKYNESNLFEGVIELFQFLKEKGIKIALGSASKNGPNIVKSLGIFKMIDYIVDPSENRGKPNPDIFLDAKNHYDLLSEECIGVEDAQAGINAINSAGMKSIGITKESVLFNFDYGYQEIKDIDYSIF
ncbi:Beta-phosphoglucomutase [Candidatus Izimaplasma bacterium HR1]|jgi:beta-phosphoglucomutase|uniref:beta-phosphoglucomutase n=1 Tax=Candidatus Izimoplasma sp. HR1 TaxID=1541959 RepID=UPI0004F6C770|nr:Beta-phosphoglucomutase [Candidatus Izimaplasma bacterium HR1]